MSYDVSECSVLVLLDLSAAFDTVDHNIRTGRPKHWGVVALDWFSSSLLRSFSEALGHYMSKSPALSCGVSQESVVGRILFALCMLPLSY